MQIREPELTTDPLFAHIWAFPGPQIRRTWCVWRPRSVAQGVFFPNPSLGQGGSAEKPAVHPYQKKSKNPPLGQVERRIMAEKADPVPFSIKPSRSSIGRSEMTDH